MAGVSVVNQVVEDCMDLPPGFRFHPTDEEIVTHYLSHKVVNRSFNPRAMGEVDLNRCEPWDLPSKAKMGVKEWYFFCHKDKKYPTGMRTNRATKAGYWKATGKDKEIYRGRGRILVGMKKTLVFYEGRAPKGTKTNWVMHEFRLEGKSNLTNVSKSVKDEWVVCRVFHKNISPKKTPQQPGMKRVDSLGEEEFFDPDETLPPLMDPPYAGPNSRPGTSLAAGGGHVDNFLLYPGFSSLMGTEIQQQFMSSNPAAPNVGALYYPQLQQQRSYHSPPGPPNMGYLHQNQDILKVLDGAPVNNDASSAIRKHCKAEQFSNQSIGCPSQDTGLSTDHNTEISSVVSKHYVVDDYLDYESIFWR